MATFIHERQDLFLKLSATAMALNASVAKLYAYHKDKYVEMRKDIEFYNELKLAYSESSIMDETLSEEFLEVSAESDDELLTWS